MYWLKKKFGSKPKPGQLIKFVRIIFLQTIRSVTGQVCLGGRATGCKTDFVGLNSIKSQFVKTHSIADDSCRLWIFEGKQIMLEIAFYSIEVYFLYPIQFGDCHLVGYSITDRASFQEAG